MSEKRQTTTSVICLTVLLYLVAGGLIVAGYAGWTIYGSIRAKFASQPSTPTIKLPEHPYTGNVMEAIDFHDPLDLDELLIAKVTYFPGGTPNSTRWIEYEAMWNGQVSSIKMLNWVNGQSGSVLGPSRKQMSPLEVSKVQAILANLPPSDGWPDCDKLLVVSRFDGGKRTTRYYNRGRLPAGIEALQSLIGIPTQQSP